MTLRPNPIRTDSSNAFAHHSMKIRVPGIIREVQAKNDYPASVNEALDALYEALTRNAEIPRPTLPAPDADMWTTAFDAHPNARWLEAEWLFAETYFFRQLALAVRYWQNGHDPYRSIKDSELNLTTRARIENVLQFKGRPHEQLAFLLENALWGNRSDLSHPVVALSQKAIQADDLLADEREAAIAHLLHGTGCVHLICDNFGTELAMDLVLTDALLSLHIPVILHLKMHPTYVSDATVPDIHHMLNWMQADKSGEVGAMATRLQQGLLQGQLQLAPDFFWNSPHFLKDLPPRLYQLFATGRMMILKGDANYRRAVYDTIYPVDTPLGAVVDYLPVPLLALRTLKSDAVVGVPISLAIKAEAEDNQWRVNGQRGVIQFVT